MGEAKRAQHTALPWVARNSQHGWSISAHRPHAVTSAYNEESIFALTRPPEERRANAEFAVRAVNAHEDLLEALREGAAECDCQSYGLDTSNCWHARARALVAKAQP